MPQADGGWMFLTLLVVLTLAVALAVLLALALKVDRRTAPPSRGIAHEPAVEILRQRYAAGEIDDEEFRRRVAALGQDAGRTSRPPG